MIKLLCEEFQKIYKKNISIMILIIISVLFYLGIIANVKVLWINILTIICLVIFNFYYIISTIMHNKLPRVNRRFKTAVLIRITSKNKEEYDDIKYKFGGEFEKFLLENNYDNIKLEYIPYHLVNKYNSNDTKQIIELLTKTNCVFLTDVKVKSEDLSNDTKYVTEFRLGIIHQTYAKPVEELFQNEINILGFSTSRLEYSKGDKIEILEVTAQRISFICKYIVARAYYLNREIKYCKDIIDVLYEKIKDKNINEILKKMVINLGYDIHMCAYSNEFEKINKNFDIIENELQKANQYIKNTYQYNECMSACVFLKYRDISKTKYYIGCCKNSNPKGTWLYSEAFLSAYINESEGTVMYKYMRAFKIKYDHAQLIIFIEEIIEEEKDKNMLNFALFLLYLEVEEYETSQNMLNKYLLNKENYCLEENTIKKIKQKYGNDFKKIIIE